MAGTACADEVPVFTVHRISIQVHGGEPNRPTSYEIKQSLSGTAPAAALAVTSTNPAADCWPVGWIAPGVDHVASLGCALPHSIGEFPWCQLSLARGVERVITDIWAREHTIYSILDEVATAARTYQEPSLDTAPSAGQY